MSSLRIGGLASGMDIDSIIEDMMRVRRIPLDKLQGDKTILEWKRADYRDINKTLFELRNKTFDMRLQGTFEKRTATSSNESAVKVSSVGSLYEGTYNVTVKQIAEGVTKGSRTELNPIREGDTPFKTIAEQFSKELKIDDLKEDDEKGKYIEFTLEGAKGSKDFTIYIEHENILDVVNKINEADLGIRASYDVENNRFFLTTTGTGKEHFIKVTNDSHNFLSFNSDDPDSESILGLNLDIQKMDEYRGKDAEIDFGDIEGLTFSSNKVTINGITLDLKAEGTSTITVTRDTDGIYEAIKEFVDLYNEALDKMNGKLQEKRYRDYPPLTEEQKKEMEEKEIELWEEKAKSGLLRGDTILTNMTSQMRLIMTSFVKNIPGEYNTLSAIGITTSENYLEGGKLHIDEEKLKAAIDNDPEAIKKLFTNDSEVESEKGLARRLYDVVVSGSGLITKKAGADSDLSNADNSMIGERLREMDKDIRRWQDRLKQIEERYWKQFTAMEKAINQMNAQSMWLMQQFGGGM